MKLLTYFLSFILAFPFFAPPAEARGERVKAARPMPQRHPMTGSKIQRPTVRPQPKPIARPQSRPSVQRPSVQRPSVQRPSVQRPTIRPQERPTERPSVQRPSIQRPSIQRPDVRPTERPSIQRPNVERPQIRPDIQRPNVERPQVRPDIQRPDIQRPSIQRPSIQRPDIQRPDISRPSSRPSIERPALNRPSTLPGMVTYPKRPEMPIKRPAGEFKRPTLQRPSTLPAIQKPQWDHKPWGGNHGIWGNNNVNINIDNHFKNNHNFSYRPNYWGARPWWSAEHHHHWHHGHWGYGWSSHYYHRHWYYRDNDFASGFMWGIAVWSLGNLVYDMGYQTYQNPYPVTPIENTYITYTQPISVAAAANPPGDEVKTEQAEERAQGAFDRSREAFKNGGYLTASQALDEALSQTPDDVSLHEYRSLVFFALGKYEQAAGVLHSVLASGPGWGWSTMVDFYDGAATYQEQLRKLEEYTKSAPEKAAARFLLGYHYMVCGHLEQANQEFAQAASLQPADSISRQLRDLTADSLPATDQPEPETPVQPDPIDPRSLVGTWVSDRGSDGQVTFTMTEGGHYTWAFKKDDQNREIAGTYSLDDRGFLVLSNDDTQMVSAVEIAEDQKMHFILIGAPDGDPGLDFLRK